MKKIRKSFKDYSTFQKVKLRYGKKYGFPVVVNAVKDGFIELPEVIPKKGVIRKRSWYIKYNLTKDENNEICLDYIAYNRFNIGMQHNRILRNGKILNLPTERPLFFIKKDWNKEQYEKAEKEYYEYNRKIHQLLKEKGLD